MKLIVLLLEHVWIRLNVRWIEHRMTKSKSRFVKRSQAALGLSYREALRYADGLSMYGLDHDASLRWARL
jgi:hypothetical protein